MNKIATILSVQLGKVITSGIKDGNDILAHSWFRSLNKKVK